MICRSSHGLHSIADDLDAKPPRNSVVRSLRFRGAIAAALDEDALVLEVRDSEDEQIVWVATHRRTYALGVRKVEPDELAALRKVFVKMSCLGGAPIRAPMMATTAMIRPPRACGACSRAAAASPAES
jgi:hypothetical protein